MIRTKKTGHNNLRFVSTTTEVASDSWAVNGARRGLRQPDVGCPNLCLHHFSNLKGCVETWSTHRGVSVLVCTQYQFVAPRVPVAAHLRYACGSYESRDFHRSSRDVVLELQSAVLCSKLFLLYPRMKFQACTFSTVT